jgi:hypothetical protein
MHPKHLLTPLYLVFSASTNCFQPFKKSFTCTGVPAQIGSQFAPKNAIVLVLEFPKNPFGYETACVAY